MKKLVMALFLGFAITSTAFAGYGEDQKGVCTDGKDSSRGQEVVVSEDVQSKEEEQKSANNK